MIIQHKEYILKLLYQIYQHGIVKLNIFKLVYQDIMYI